MRKLWLAILGLLGVIALVAASCTSGEAPTGQSAIEIVDQLGRVVRLEGPPQRIVSLAPSNTEILFALGLGDKVVGVTKYCNFPAEAKEKPKIGGFSTPDIEKIVALEPDLVVATQIHEKQVVPELENRGLTVMVISPKTINDVVATIELAGRATGAEAVAGRLVEEMRARLAAVENLVRGVSDEARPRVFYALWHDPLMTVGHDTLQGELITLAGGKNVFDDLTGYPTVDLEALVERQPQVIVAGTGHGSGEDASLQWAISEPRLEGTDARKSGRVVAINADIASRPGPRIVDALEEMLRLLHPDLAAK